MIYKSIRFSNGGKKVPTKHVSAVLYFIPDSKLLKNNIRKIIKNDGLILTDCELDLFQDEKEKELFTAVKSGIYNYVILSKFEKHKLTLDSFRNYLSGIIKKLNDKKVTRLELHQPEFSDVKSVFQTEAALVETILEGLLLGNYSFDKYKSEKKQKYDLRVLFHTKIKITSLSEKVESLIDSVAFARDLVNEPANVLTPLELIKRTKKAFQNEVVSVSAIDQKGLVKNKMGGILAVGGASSNPPYLLILKYKPKARVKRKIALVGKGVTYDSGGLSIKPTNGMLEMKADMAGAATVIGTVLSAARHKLPVEITGIIPAVENMISGSSYKPGDIVKSYSGKSIEVKDTDAEGRIVLADALHYASRLKPDLIIDFATLTGAVAVALGLFTAGLMTKNDELAKEILSASEEVDEPLWRLPFNDDFKPLIESDIADISNLGPRWGGAITAGKFLEYFVDDKIPYAHIDLAGPALEHKYRNYTEKFHTGFGVRLMSCYLKKLSS
ncbi:MAG: leucyl aminopeptidase [Melioribacteraceae bacterium]|nr:leucyl aminopeptidase [Melioribacteraceae bacterium]